MANRKPKTGKVEHIPHQDLPRVRRVHEQMTTPATAADVARGYAVVGARRRGQRGPAAPTPGTKRVSQLKSETPPASGKAFGG